MVDCRMENCVWLCKWANSTLFNLFRASSFSALEIELSVSSFAFSFSLSSLRFKCFNPIPAMVAVLANLKKQIATAKVNAQRAATIKAQEEIEATK